MRLEPVLIELEREQEDLLIIGHASVIRCLLAYLIGLPASEIPAIEIARGDLLEVVPASYGVHSHAFHFWDGPGRRGEGGDMMDVKDANNFYENYAESTKGKRKVSVEENDEATSEAQAREVAKHQEMQDASLPSSAETTPTINIHSD